MTTNVLEPKVTVSITSSPSSDFGMPDTGTITSTKDGGWVLNPKSTFPLTIYGIDQSTAEEVKRLLDEGCSLGTYAHAHTLIPIVARSNLRCKEVDQYIKKFKPLYLQSLGELKQSSAEWATASEKDREDLLTSFRQEAIESLDVQPYCDLETLFEGEPTDVTIDDALIDKYGYENLQLYLRYAGKLDKVRVIPANHYERKGFEKLVALGLAVRGSDIPFSAILETLKLKQMKELVADLNPPPFRRKAQAIEFLLSVPNIKERTGKVVAFRELFQLQPLPDDFSDIDLNQISAGWKYVSEIAILLAHTYVTSGYSSQKGEQYQDDISYISGWELSPVGDDATCPYCKRAATKIYPKNEPPRVPLHIGCRCSVLPKLEN